MLLNASHVYSKMIESHGTTFAGIVTSIPVIHFIHYTHNVDIHIQHLHKGAVRFIDFFGIKNVHVCCDPLAAHSWVSQMHLVTQNFSAWQLETNTFGLLYESFQDYNRWTNGFWKLMEEMFLYVLYLTVAVGAHSLLAVLINVVILCNLNQMKCIVPSWFEHTAV